MNKYIDSYRYLSYSSIGLFVSKEMVKVYDHVGRLYDETGSHGNWWDKLTDRTFDNFVKCYEKQVKDLDDVIDTMDNVNRFKLVEQLIVDKTIFKQAILAYRSYAKQNSEELGLIGLNLTAEQLFWVNSAKTYYDMKKQTDKSDDMIKFK